MSTPMGIGWVLGFSPGTALPFNSAKRAGKEGIQRNMVLRKLTSIQPGALSAPSPAGPITLLQLELETCQDGELTPPEISYYTTGLCWQLFLILS